MSRLLEIKRNQLDKKQNECLNFTNVMKKIINNQEDRTGVISYTHFFSRQPINYPTSCNEFREFCKEINNDPHNKINIRYNDRHVNHITTSVDMEKDLVIYRLYYYDEYDFAM